MKDKLKAYLLLFFFGGLGAHLFYLKKYKRAILHIFTWGFFGIGWLYDLITLSKQVDKYNESLECTWDWEPSIPRDKPRNKKSSVKNITY